MVASSYLMTPCPASEALATSTNLNLAQPVILQNMPKQLLGPMVGSQTSAELISPFLGP